MALKIGNDHWAFLDEIEAPMWVDLILEVKSNYKYIDDGWFHTSHLFHQLPSFELKVAFSHSGDGAASLDIDSKGPSSPKLPSSVSRSRGKHYLSKKQKEGQHIILLDKKHPVKVLSQKSLWVNSGAGEEIMPNSKGTSRSQRSFVVQRNSTGNAKNSDSKATSSHGYSQCSSSCMEDRSDSNASIITCESDQKPQPKNPDVPSQTFGYSSGLLSAMRNSLRKSCVTRQASRVDVSNRRQSRDSSSVSGKSSVGSSSNPGCELKSSTFALKQQREQTPDSRGEATMIRATKTKEKGYTISRASNIEGKDGTCNSRRRGNNISKPAQHDATKSKVQNQTLHAKASIRYGVDEQRLLTGAPKAKEKVTVCGRNRFVGDGNKNLTGRVPVNQKCHGGDVTTGVMARGQKGTKQDDRTRFVGFKGKLSSPSSGKHPTTSATQRVYLR